MGPAGLLGLPRLRIYELALHTMVQLLQSQHMPEASPMVICGDCGDLLTIVAFPWQATFAVAEVAHEVVVV